MSGFDRVVRRARLACDAVVDIGISAGRIAAMAPRLPGEAPELDAAGRLVTPGLVETHLHLDKTCIMDRCTLAEGTVAEAVRETSAAKRGFTAEDIHARGSQLLCQCVAHGTTRIRTHVELDPGIGMLGFEAVDQLRRDFSWAVEIELCVFPQEGLISNPGTEPLLRQALRQGAKLLGAAPYIDSDPRGQIDLIFAMAREYDVDIDMHLDLADSTEGMQAEYVCELTERHGWGGRVAIGHATQLSLLPPARFAALGKRLADAGVAVTILPATDLYLMGRTSTHAVPRGVVPGAPLLAAGVNCSVSTNNVLNPFTPYGDGSLLRMANLYANVCQVAHGAGLAECLAMVTDRAARLMNLADYGIAVGNPADLVLFDAPSPAAAVAELAQPLWGMKAGRLSFTRARPQLFPPEEPEP